jgi:preprotein translocase subunit Sec61beta
MAKEEGGMLPSSQGGLMMYTDADTGIDLDPKIIVGLGAGTGLLVMIGHARPLLAGIFL